MEVAPHYTAYTVNIDYTVFTALHCLNSSIYAYNT